MPSKVINAIQRADGCELDIVHNYKAHLQAMGYCESFLAKCVRVVIHLMTWLSAKGIPIELLDIRVLDQFLNHDCTCPGPHGYRKNLQRMNWQLHQFLGFLMEAGVARLPEQIEIDSHAVESFLKTLAAKGYVQDSVVAYRKRCRHLIVWLYLQDIKLVKISDDTLTQFLSHQCTCVHPHFFIRGNRFSGCDNSHIKIRVFIKYLRDTGIVSPRVCPTSEETGQYLAQYQNWLRNYRNIQEKTVQSYRKAVELFIVHLGDEPDRYSATLIRTAVQRRLETASRELVRRQVSAFRQYLRFRTLNGLCRPGLAAAVPMIPRQRFSTLPRHLPQEDIERIIASCDLTTAMGIRDRAILLLLARLALRAGDVANLELQDIDWDNALVRVSGKSRCAAALPLPQDVGDALRNYIVHARLVSATEKVFLRMPPPIDQALSSGGVSAVAGAAIKRVGIKADGLPAAHLFRHSAATNLLHDHTPLEVISALLRHQSMTTTAVYARVDIRMLRDVAQPWPTAGGLQ